MSNIQRYDVGDLEDPRPYPHSEGDWMKYRDHISELKAMRDENDRLRGIAINLSNITKCWENHYDHGVTNPHPETLREGAETSRELLRNISPAHVNWIPNAPKQDGGSKCEDCTTYFASYKCNKPLECDCPKCQGLCLCNNCVTCEGDRKVNSRRQLCGCIICYCEGDQCQGCGAGMCPAHANYYATSGLMFDGYGKEPCPTCTVTT